MTEQARLRAALAFALEEMEDMVTYVPEYFREKWGYDDSIATVRRVLAEVPE